MSINSSGSAGERLRLLLHLPGDPTYSLLPSMPSSINKDFQDDEQRDDHVGHNAEDPDAEFGGTEARQKLEKKLLRKLDLRMSVLIVIYILNYVSVLSYVLAYVEFSAC